MTKSQGKQVSAKELFEDFSNDPLDTFSPNSLDIDNYNIAPEAMDAFHNAASTVASLWALKYDDKAAQEIASNRSIEASLAAERANGSAVRDAPDSTELPADAKPGDDSPVSVPSEEGNGVKTVEDVTSPSPRLQSEDVRFGDPSSHGFAIVEGDEKGHDYRLRKLVARGGMGEVWEARQESLCRVIAVKTIRSDASKTRDRWKHQFFQEAILSARLEHPNIIPVHDLGRTETGDPLLAMKFVRGEPWNKILRRDFKKLNEIDFLAKHISILVDVAQAVAFAHSRGVVHRDLKPAQVMIGRYGETQLMDWGLAVYLPEIIESNPHDSASDIDEKISGLFVRETALNPAGTPAMMAPEQTEDTTQRIGPWTDVYLLGGTLYCLLTGTYPHGSKDAKQSILRAQKGKVESPEQRVKDRMIPQELSRLAMQALIPDPTERLSSALEFVERLQDYLSGATNRHESEELTREAEEELKDLQVDSMELSATDMCTSRGDIADKLTYALRLWPGNVRALELDLQNLAARTRIEIEQGDLLFAQVHLNRLKRIEPEIKDHKPQSGEIQELLNKSLRARTLAKIRRLILIIFVIIFFFAALAMGLSAKRNSDLAVIEAKYAGLEQEYSRRLANRMEGLEHAATTGGKGAQSLVVFVFDELVETLERELDDNQNVDARDATVIKEAIAGSMSQKVLEYIQELDYLQWPVDVQIEHSNRCFSMAVRLAELHHYAPSLALAQRSLMIREQIMGRDNPNILESIHLVADLHTAKNNLMQAELILNDAVVRFGETLGEEHPETQKLIEKLELLTQFQSTNSSALIPSLENADN
jgi:serine/threonine protein kinase